MSDLSCKEVARALGAATETADGWTARCPAHDDNTPSLSLKMKGKTLLVHCHAGCTQSSVLNALKHRNLWNSRGHTASLQLQRNGATEGCTLIQYAEAKGLPKPFLRRECGLRNVMYRGQSAVEIPYLDIKGDTVATRYRVGATGSNKFRWRKGDKPALYGLDRLNGLSREFICLVEGESDCQTLWSEGIPAIGVPGAGMWSDSRDAPYLETFDVIYLIVEPDSGGLALKEKLNNSQLRNKIRVVRLGRFKDTNEYFQHAPTTFRARWQKKLDGALSLEIDATKSKHLEREAFRQNCGDLLKSKNLLATFASDFQRLGAVGVTRHAKLIFLATVSRLFDRPVSIAVKGPSSGGKSFLVESVLKFFPPSAYYALTAMSERALAYSEEPLQHRMLIIYEAAGMGGDIQSYFIRSLLSEGKIRYETVQRSENGPLQARLIEKEGPTGLIVTTTAVALHPENETRLLSITVTDTPKQTRAIMIAQAEGQASETLNLSKWHSLHDWITAGPRKVHIPFARILAENVNATGIRLRRDFTTLLSFIRAHALLHQENRDLNRTEVVVATLQDYAAVYSLIARYIQEGVEATVPAQVREIVELVAQASSATDGIALPSLATDLKLDKSSVSRRARRAVDLGYLKNLEDRKGRPARFVVGEPLPEDEVILPSPETLEQRCAVARKKGKIASAGNGSQTRIDRS